MGLHKSMLTRSAEVLPEALVISEHDRRGGYSEPINKANRYVKVPFSWITSLAVNSNDVKRTFQGPQD